MLAKDKLRVDWSKKENDFMFHFPLGTGTINDAHYLHQFFGEEFEKEMTERGYDITTLKFSIEPQGGNSKFASQRQDPTTPIKLRQEKIDSLKKKYQL